MTTEQPGPLADSTQTGSAFVMNRRHDERIRDLQRQSPIADGNPDPHRRKSRMTQTPASNSRNSSHKTVRQRSDHVADGADAIGAIAAQESIRILELSDEQVSLEQACLDLTSGETEFAVGSSSSVKEA